MYRHTLVYLTGHPAPQDTAGESNARTLSQCNTQTFSRTKNWRAINLFVYYVMGHTSYKRKVQRFIKESVDHFFKTREFDKNVTRVMNKGKSPRIEEFEGDAYNITRISQGGSEVDVFRGPADKISSIRAFVNFSHDDGHKLVTGHCSLPGNGVFFDGVIAHSYGGLIGDAQLKFEHDAGANLVRVYIENIQSTGTAFVFSATWRVTVFYK